MKMAIFCILFIPVFWVVFMGIIYALLILFYTIITHSTWDPYYYGSYFRAEIFTFQFFLVRYLDSQAWFISFPLLAIWGTYYWRMRRGHGEA